METKQFVDFEIKTDESDETGNTFIGYGAVFNNADSYNDVILPGAFADSLKSGRKVKMCYQHNTSAIIGVWEIIEEDEKGLKVQGKFADTSLARDVKELVRIGAIDSMSIGYSVSDYAYTEDEKRLLKKINLYEISIVSFPANELAAIDAVKAAEMTKTELEKFLTNAGMSRNTAKALIAKGFSGLQKSDSAQGSIETDNINNDIESSYVEYMETLKKSINLFK